MEETELTRHGAKALKGNNDNGNQNFANNNVWFEWGDAEEHVVRLVGDFKWARSHWIGPSQFGEDVEIVNSTAFKGENKLLMNVACSDWDMDRETEVDDEERTCPVCRLGHNAEKMLKKHGKELEESDKKNIQNIRRKCNVRNVYLFKCIDRDNPYVDKDKTVKGFKIIKMPSELLNAIIELSKKLKGVNITSPDEGIDITIKRVKPEGNKKGKTNYTALPVYEGMTVKQTPLTDEEKQYHDFDLSKFAGKPVDKTRFEEELSEANNVKLIYESETEESNDAPF